VPIPKILALPVIALALAACTDANPLIGEWTMDRADTAPGAAALATKSGLDHITFAPTTVLAGDTELAVDYIVEGDRIRIVRRERDYEDLVELLEDGRIRVHLPAGIPVVYKRGQPS
jgi:hypothetical protein